MGVVPYNNQLSRSSALKMYKIVGAYLFFYAMVSEKNISKICFHSKGVFSSQRFFMFYENFVYAGMVLHNLQQWVME